MVHWRIESSAHATDCQSDWFFLENFEDSVIWNSRWISKYKTNWQQQNSALVGTIVSPASYLSIEVKIWPRFLNSLLMTMTLEYYCIFFHILNWPLLTGLLRGSTAYNLPLPVRTISGSAAYSARGRLLLLARLLPTAPRSMAGSTRTGLLMRVPRDLERRRGEPTPPPLLR